MRLSELLEERDFGLRLVAPLDHDPVLTGAHSIELPDAGRWIAPGYLVLTTGLALRGRVRRQREFVRSLADARAGAIGFGVGVGFDRVPGGLASAAAERGLPLFTIPLETAFRDIIRFVLVATLDDDLRQFGRAVALQDYLMGAVDASAPEQELADRLEELVNGDVAVFSTSGAVVAVAGRPQVHELWDAVGTARAHVVAPGGSILATTVRTRGRVRYHLAVAVRRDEATDTLLRPLIRFAGRVLQLVAIGRDAESDQRRVERGRVLDRLLARPERARGELRELSATSGFSTRGPLRLLVARPVGDGDVPAGQQLAAALDRLFEERREPHAVTVWRGFAVALWQGGDIDGDVAAVAGEDPLAVGIAPPFDDPERVGRAVAEARAAWLVSERTGGREAIRFGASGLAELVLGSTDDADAVAAAVLAPIRAAGTELVATLEAYFDHDLDVVSTARQLHLHPNSVRYRLGRVEAALGRPLKSPETIAELYLALRAGRTAAAGEPPGGSHT